ncbi:MAG TPA: hypothetical protein VFQ85_11610 [Mycobacteriales bacterium]|nr:hypothetical protein [Mycobacteriales bacterium]
MPVPRSAGGAASPCVTAWADPRADTFYETGAGAGATVPDDDLDATAVTVRVTATDVVVTAKVAALNAAGPAVGTGHGLLLTFTANRRPLVYAARKDATYGDATETPDIATDLLLTADARASAFTLTLRRADLARAAQTVSGTLTGVAVSTIRYDHAEAALDATPLGTGEVGHRADTTLAAPAGATVSLTACDALLRRTSLRVAVSGPATRRTVAATLRSGDGTPLPGQAVRLVSGGRTIAGARTDATGTARLTAPGGRTATVVYGGVPGAHDPVSAQVRL